MELLQSKHFKLPTLYFITDREEIRELPVGIPFIYGEEKDKSFIIRILEYEILYQRAIASGYPFNFKKILEDAGFEDLKSYWYNNPVYLEYVTGEEGTDVGFIEPKPEDKDSSLFKEFIRDSSCYVDITVLKELNVFPTWLDDIEKAIETNIHNFAVFNNNMYNKKLDGMYGGIELISPNKNLIIIDISGSIPKAVSTTCLTLSKNLAESFYADLLITGSKSTLYPYENINELDIDIIYEENGMDNDQVWFKKLVENEKHYKTAIVFGDNHSPSDKWSNEYNVNTHIISREDGKKLCKWKIDNLISFHTDSTRYTAGYADWFTVDNIEKIDNWLKYL